MDELKAQIIEQFKQLIESYKRNAATQSDIISTRTYKSGVYLNDTRNEAYIKYSITELLIKKVGIGESKDTMSREYITEVLKDHIEKAMIGDSDIDQVCDQMIEKLRKTKIQTFEFLIPAMIHLSSIDDVKIIDLELTSNPSKCWKEISENSYEDIGISTDRIVDFAVGAKATVLAPDHNSAKRKLRILAREVVGLLKLGWPKYEINFFAEQTEAAHETILSNASIGFSNHTSTINKIFFDKEAYDLLREKGLDWLNDWKSHKDTKKADKLKRAFYWYSYAVNELGPTNKFIYLVTILETLFKKDDEKVEVATTIATRIVLFLTSDLELRQSISKGIKNIYRKRSDILHTGALLSLRDEILIDEIEGYVRRSLWGTLKAFSNSNCLFNDFIGDLEKMKFGYQDESIDSLRGNKC